MQDRQMIKFAINFMNQADKVMTKVFQQLWPKITWYWDNLTIGVVVVLALIAFILIMAIEFARLEFKLRKAKKEVFKDDD